MKEIQKVFKSVISYFKYSRPSNQWPALFLALLVSSWWWSEIVIHRMQLRCLYFSCYENGFFFFIVIINGFNPQSPAPGLYSSRCATNICKRSRLNLNLNFSMITVITERALRNFLSRLLNEKSGGAILKPSTGKDQTSTSSPLSSVCLNAPFYCFEQVIRPRNSIIILYSFLLLRLSVDRS